MKYFSLLLLLTVYQLSWAQKAYTISSHTISAWAPMDDGSVLCLSKLTNTTLNSADSTFTWEYLDSQQPSTWTLGFCALPSCYSIPAVVKADFYVSKGTTIEFDCTHNFGNFGSYVAGTGTARFLIYRQGMKNNADTITFIGQAAGSGVRAIGKNLDIKVSPNPVKNELILNLSDPNITSVSILNLVGKEVMFLDFKASKSFDVSTLPSGIYFLHVTKGSATFNKKFVISR